MTQKKLVNIGACHNKKNNSCVAGKKLLIIGALPDYKRNLYGGATVLMHNFLCYLDAHNLPYTFVRTNRYRDKNGNLRRRINKIVFFVNFLVMLPFHKIVMFNFSDNATVNMYPFLSRISRILRKKTILRKFGGSLAIYMENISEKKRRKTADALNKSDLVIFETKSGLEHLHQFAVQTSNKTMWFPNVREKGLMKDPSDFNKRLVYFGHVKDEKGVGDLIKIADMLPDEYTMEIYGRIVEDKYRDYDWTAHNVKYMGEVSSKEVVKILSEATLLVIASYYREGYPGCIIEAFAAGLPVVASNVGGIPEIVEDGINGRLCNPGDIEAFRDAILSFDMANYPYYCKNALDSFNKYFNADIVNERVYRKLQII